MARTGVAIIRPARAPISRHIAAANSSSSSRPPAARARSAARRRGAHHELGPAGELEQPTGPSPTLTGRLPFSRALASRCDSTIVLRPPSTCHVAPIVLGARPAARPAPVKSPLARETRALYPSRSRNRFAMGGPRRAPLPPREAMQSSCLNSRSAAGPRTSPSPGASATCLYARSRPFAAARRPRRAARPLGPAQ